MCNLPSNTDFLGKLRKILSTCYVFEEVLSCSFQGWRDEDGWPRAGPWRHFIPNLALLSSDCPAFVSTVSKLSGLRTCNRWERKPTPPGEYLSQNMSASRFQGVEVASERLSYNYLHSDQTVGSAHMKSLEKGMIYCRGGIVTGRTALEDSV